MGCGECSACRVTEDCGACSTCLLQLPHDVASGLFCKCERRRCLRIVEKVSWAGGVGPRLTLTPGPHSPGPVHHASGPPQSRGCGVCRGCQTREDCGRCRVCLRPPRPGLRRQWRCIQRRCLRVSQAGGAGAGGARAGAELILLLTAAAASSQPGLAHLMSSFLLHPTLTSLAPSTCPCLPASCSPPASPPSAMSTTPSPSCGSPCCECPILHSACLVLCMLSALLGGEGLVSAWCHQA